jgi:hypothetical protein
MVSEIIEEVEGIGAGLPQVRPTYGYYRQPNGWITVAVTTMLERMKYEREGWESLDRYGRFDFNNVYAANHPLEGLLMKGGAHELTVEQVVESGMWMDPPLIPVCGQHRTQLHPRHLAGCWRGAQAAEFPQVPADTPRSHECRLCGAQKPTEAARDQHEAVAHKDERGDIRTGQALADAIVSGLRGGSDAPPDACNLHPGGCPEGSHGPGDVLSVLAEVGLNKRQIEALRERGLYLVEETEEGSPTGPLDE